MSNDKLVSRALRDLRKQIANAEDPKKLKELVIEINALLDLIEMQGAKLDSLQPPFTN